MKNILILLTFALSHLSFTTKVTGSLFITASYKAQQFAFGVNTSDTTAGIWEANSPGNYHGNRRYQMIVHKSKITIYGKRLLLPAMTATHTSIVNPSFLWVDRTTGEFKMSRMDSLNKMLNASLDFVPSVQAKTYYSLSGTVTPVTKELNAIVTPTSANSYTVNISAASFNAISSVQVTSSKNTTLTASCPIAWIKSYTTSQVVISIVESNTQTSNVLLNLLGGLTAVLTGPPNIYADVIGLTFHLKVTGN